MWFSSKFVGFLNILCISILVSQREKSQVDTRVIAKDPNKEETGGIMVNLAV